MISRAMSSNASRGQGKFIGRPFGHFGIKSKFAPSFLLSKQIGGRLPELGPI
jgi:hypothetical protein